MASTDCAANVCRRSMVPLGKLPGCLRRITSAPTTRFVWHGEARPKSGPHCDHSDRAWRLVADVCDLQWLPVLDRLAESIGSTGWLASDCRNQLIAQAIRCPHLQCLVQLIKDIDHPSIRIRKLDRLGNDRAQHGFEIKRGVDCPRHLAKRAIGLLESSTEMMLA